jgi:hypothetical protein
VVRQSWTLLLALTAVCAVVTYMRCPGCIERERVNKTCEWTDDTPFAFDPQSAAHQAHLAKDAQLAEELAIRYADAEFGKRTGIEHHGGSIDSGHFRAECLSRMFAAIESAHGVTSTRAQAARGRRNPTYDLAVVLLFLPLYSLSATLACLWLLRRFSSDERRARLVAVSAAAAGFSLLGVQALWLWGAVWEVVRVGNGHMTSIRAASYTRWNSAYPGADYIAGVFLFLLIALFCYWVVSDEERSTNVSGPCGILLH